MAVDYVKHPESIWGTCGCGKPADKSSSGSPECWPCWNLRKLDRPAARHWAPAAEQFLSNIDMYDCMTFLPAAGLSQEEFSAMFASVKKVLDYSREVLAK